MADQPNISSNQPPVKVNGKEYVRIGDRLVDPKTITTETIRHADGRVDTTVHVPYQIGRAHV